MVIHANVRNIHFTQKSKRGLHRTKSNNCESVTIYWIKRSKKLILEGQFNNTTFFPASRAPPHSDHRFDASEGKERRRAQAHVARFILYNEPASYKQACLLSNFNNNTLQLASPPSLSLNTSEQL